MLFEIILAPEAVAALRALPAFRRANVKHAIETHLRHEPRKGSKSRIKRLRGLSRPQYHLRVDDIRVFYDVVNEEVQILALVTKADAEAWLEEYGDAEP